MQPALFLDRDGVIIENRENYVRTWSDVVFYPAALEALKRISSHPIRIVIITNQSAIGRGILTLEAAQQINTQVCLEIEKAGGRIDGVYMCPHRPEEGCNCRKPGPGLLFQAAADLSIDLNCSILIGDALSDIQAGRAAGVAQTALVLTGRGSQQLLLPKASKLQPLLTFPNLASALNTLLP